VALAWSNPERARERVASALELDPTGASARAAVGVPETPRTLRGLQARAAQLEDRARRLGARHDLELAVRAWSMVTFEEPRDASAWLVRARLAQMVEAWDEALALVARARAVAPRSVEAALLEAELRGLLLPREADRLTRRPLALRSYLDALAALQDPPVPSDGRTLLLEARLRREHRMEGAEERALLALEVAATDVPADLATEEGRAHARTRLEIFSFLESLGVASLDRRQALESTLQDRALVELATARELLTAKDPAAALAHADVALELAPSLAEAWYVRSSCLMAAGELIPASLDLTEAVRLDPTLFDRAFLGTLGRSFDVEALTAAIEPYVRAPRPHGLFLRAAYTLARAHIRRGTQLAPAIADVDEVLARDRTFEAARILRALLHIEVARAAQGEAREVALRQALLDLAGVRTGGAAYAEALAWSLRCEGATGAETVTYKTSALAARRAARERGLELRSLLLGDRAFDAIRGERDFWDAAR
jgi:tetratricopeptide (TPR) repeat protein